MSKKEKCKVIMERLFGPATAALVDNMEEDEVVDTCKKKVTAMLGEDKAKEFDSVK
jgi:hypothetical protein